MESNLFAGAMQKISQKLVKRVFLSYFVIAFLITGGHIVIQYFDESDRINILLNDYKGMVYSALGTALWNYDKESLDSALQGIVNTPNICYTSATALGDEKPLSLVRNPSCKSDSNLSMFQFEVKHSDDGGQLTDVGTVIFAYDSGIVVRNTIDRMYIILALSFIKTMILWGIIIYWGRSLVEVPLRLMTEMCQKLVEEKNDPEELWYEKQIHTKDEIEKLEDTFIALMEQIKQLSQDSRAKSAFLSNMSHEFRTPLNAIIGYSELIVEEMEDQEKIQSEELLPDAQRILLSGRHLLSVVNKVLDISKMESGEMNFSFERIDLPDFVDQVEAILNPLMEKNNNKFEVDIAYGLRELNSDVVRLKQILLNLLSNAAKFTNDGLISLIAKPLKKDGKVGVLFEVKDTGMGISEENLTKVFKKFVQVHDISKDTLAGTGLGLPLCKSLAEGLGGSIDLKSKLGEGSCFSLFMPNQQEKSLNQNSSHTRVLLVDDDLDVLDTYSIILEDHCQLDIASTGSEALACLKSANYDMMFLDLHMPEMNGIELLKAVQNEGMALPTSYLLTGSEVEDYFKKAMDLGIQGVLKKPIDAQELLSALKTKLKKAS